jgi:Flp pilus assembly protein TadG
MSIRFVRRFGTAVRAHRTHRVHRVCRDDRGTVVLESAMVFPLLMLIVLGALEFGLGWRDKLTVETSVRSGARAGANLGNIPLADYNILANLNAALGSIPAANVSKIVIYRADTVDGAVPTACLTASQNTVLVKCNLYTSTALSAPASSFGCGGGSLDATWCPIGREVSQASVNGPDYLGVYVQVQHDYVTAMFGTSGLTLKTRAVTRLEPQ